MEVKDGLDLYSNICVIGNVSGSSSIVSELNRCSSQSFYIRVDTLLSVEKGIDFSSSNCFKDKKIYIVFSDETESTGNRYKIISSIDFFQFESFEYGISRLIEEIEIPRCLVSSLGRYSISVYLINKNSNIKTILQGEKINEYKFISF